MRRHALAPPLPGCAVRSPGWRPMAWCVFMGWVLCSLAACVFVPVTTERYDPDCRITARQMTLQSVQLASFGSCHGNDCAALLVFVGATAAASAVVSGSIVVAGNVVYWFEKQGLCRQAP